jgi:LacI family transcriptional regulator
MMKQRAPRSITITDIANAAGVSKSTVSLVLKNSPLIKAATAEKVWAAAHRLGYVYNRGAANLRHGSSNIVGMIVNDLTNPFFVELLIGVERVLLKSGFITLLAHTAEDSTIQNRVLASMREHNAAGIILCPVLDSPADLPAQISDWGLPLVVVVRQLGKLDYDFVGSDSCAGMHLATEHLLSKGHRKIAYIGRRGGSQVSRQRRKGYLDALREHGVDTEDRWIIDAPISSLGGQQGIETLLGLDDRPTAVVCYNDSVAMGVLHELGNRGLQAGRDIGVVGFDDIAEAAHTNPPLTTMAVNPQHQGELASRLLLERLGNRTAPPTKHIIRPELVVRATA